MSCFEFPIVPENLLEAIQSLLSQLATVEQLCHNFANAAWVVSMAQIVTHYSVIVEHLVNFTQKHQKCQRTFREQSLKLIISCIIVL